MENYPENSSLFFLSLAEREQLRPIVDLVQEILLQFRIVGQSESEAQQALSEIADAEFKKQCKARKINTGAALKIATRLQLEKWFCTYQSGATYGDLTGHDKARPVLIYSALTSDDRNAVQLDISESPDFYRIIQDSFEFPDTMSIEDFYAQQRKALNLTEQYRYIDVDHLEALFNISDIFGAKKAVSVQRLVARRIASITYPIDKPNSEIWNWLSTTDPNGQIALLPFSVESPKLKKQGKEVNIYYSLDLTGLPESMKISRELEPFDKACYVAIAALFNAGNDVMTTGMIHKAMGGTTNPSANDLKRINQSITKMTTARITLDNQEEIDNDINYPLFKWDASLLPMERVTVTIRGQKTTTAIRLYREPPMITFAKERKQVTALPPAVMQFPLSKTNSNLLLHDYLIERISRIRNGNGKNKMLFATIYEKTNNKTPKQKQRALEKIRTLLDHYKKCDFIKDYRESKDGITITL